MRVRLTFFCAALTAAAAPRVARAQDQNPVSIPTELAVALLEGSDFGAGRQARIVVVGRAPDGMLQRVTSLEGGGMTSRGGGGGSGGNSSSISTWLIGPLKPAELIAEAS